MPAALLHTPLQTLRSQEASQGQAESGWNLRSCSIDRLRRFPGGVLFKMLQPANMQRLAPTVTRTSHFRVLQEIACSVDRPEIRLSSGCLLSSLLSLPTATNSRKFVLLLHTYSALSAQHVSSRWTSPAPKPKPATIYPIGTKHPLPGPWIISF
ncbi:hypothetical protein BDW74DRAFT_149762 [Aspergillus multicolor]|uniref:uncharacterized protein n=1 Tax=Aspergillus multicolor TaxID=41759 RepID=UPI003CCC907C